MAVVQLPGPPTAYRIRGGETMARVWPGQRVFTSEYTGDVNVTSGAPSKHAGVAVIKFEFNETAQKAARAWLAQCDGANNVHPGFDPDAERYGAQVTAQGYRETTFNWGSAEPGLAAFGDKLVAGTSSGVVAVDLASGEPGADSFTPALPFTPFSTAVLSDGGMLLFDEGGYYVHAQADGELAELTSATEPRARLGAPQNATGGAAGAVAAGSVLLVAHADGRVTAYALSDVLDPPVAGTLKSVAAIETWRLSASSSAAAPRGVVAARGLWPSPFGADRARSMVRTRWEADLTESAGNLVWHVLDFGLRPMSGFNVSGVIGGSAPIAAATELNGSLYYIRDSTLREAPLGDVGTINIRYDVTNVQLVEDENGWYEAVSIPWRQV